MEQNEIMKENNTNITSDVLRRNYYESNSNTRS